MRPFPADLSPRTLLEIRDELVRDQVRAQGAGHPGSSRTRIQIAQIAIDPDQPRRDATVGVAELASSLVTHGLLQPVLVAEQGSGFVIVAGERRLRAAKRLGWTVIDAIVLGAGTRRTAVAIVENIQRRQLARPERREAFLKILDECGGDKDGAAALLGVSLTTFYRTIAEDRGPKYSNFSARGLLNKIEELARGMDASARRELAADLVALATTISRGVE